jgi:hypothetical protein
LIFYCQTVRAPVNLSPEKMLNIMPVPLMQIDANSSIELYNIHIFMTTGKHQGFFPVSYFKYSEKCCHVIEKCYRLNNSQITNRIYMNLLFMLKLFMCRMICRLTGFPLIAIKIVA